MASEQELIRRIAEGDQSSFGLLIEPYRSELARFASRQLGPNRQLAEDVIQQAMFDAYRSLTAGTKPENVRAWLFTIVRNCAANARRAAQPARPVTEVDHDARHQTPNDQAEQREWMDWLVSAIGQLPDRQRDVLVGQAFEGRTHRELAARLGTTVLAVKTLSHRARKRLSELRSQALMSIGPLIRGQLAGFRGGLGSVGQVLATAGITSAVLLSSGGGTAPLLAAPARAGAAAPRMQAPAGSRHHPGAQHRALSKRRIRTEARKATGRCLHGRSLRGLTPQALDYAAHHLSADAQEYTECELLLRRQALAVAVADGRRSPEHRRRKI